MPAVTPTIAPPDVTVARLLVALHAPPVAVLVSVVVAAAQTDDAPDIVPEFGEGLMVITVDATDVPQADVKLYIIVSMPVAIPITTPELVIVARLLVPLHAPPAAVALSVMVAPVHTLAGPEIETVPAEGLMVTANVAVAVPQVLATV
jgi:hypothetical protein